MKKNFITSLWAVAILWVIFIANFLFFTIEFRNYGIRPRDVDGLIGIVTSPFLHANWSHLISNSIPLFILLMTILSFYRRVWVNVTIFSIIIGGFAVWAFARGNTNHIGASGVIFSFIGFLLASGIFRMKLKSILIAVVIFFLYGGALFRGVIPNQQGISWEGHLFGAIAGVILAWVFRKINRKEKPLAE